jgi:hypothetical protein
MTIHGESTQSTAPAPRTRWVRPEEVRTPVTVKEGEAALDLIDHAMDRLEETIGRRAQRGEDSTGLKVLLASWGSRRAEVVYAVERLEAGEPPVSVDLARLRAQVEDLTRQNTDQLKRLKEQRAMIVSLTEKSAGKPAHVASLELQVAALTQRNAGLADALRTMKPPVQPDEAKRALKKSVHDAFAFGAEALDDLVQAGVTLTPLAALFLEHCNSSVPRGYRAEWRVVQGTFKRDVAVSRAERATGSGE